MRLIDADVLMRNIGKIPQLRGITYGRMKRAVDDTPTIEADPVRHGQWVVVEPDGWNHRGYNVTPKIKCSVCEHVPKEHKTEDYGQGGTIVSYSWDRTTYCPHCGAKMDAEED